MLRNKEKGMIDMDSILAAQMYGRDGVHFNVEGESALKEDYSNGVKKRKDVLMDLSYRLPQALRR